MVISGHTRLAGVIGSPVRHSLSPTIHNAGFAAAEIDARFVAFPVEAGHAAEAIDAMRTFDLLGLSVTMPHKEAVIAACDRVTERARALGSVNCIFRDGSDVVGDSTDGAGFIKGLQSELGFDPSGTRCAVIGAGGAARAVVLALADAGAQRIEVINRSADRGDVAVALAPSVARRGNVADLGAVDLVVNATPVGMADTPHSAAAPFDVSVLSKGTVVSDLIYHPSETPLLAQVRARGLGNQNGLAMLVFQAAVAFEHFTDSAAPVDAMMSAARKAIAP